MLQELEEAMEEVEIKSQFSGYVFRLSDILIIMICGLLCNLKDINRIHEWSKSKNAREFLKKEFKITNIPCRSHFYKILSYVNYEVFSLAFSHWIELVIKGKYPNKVISMDGKTIRSTHKYSHNGRILHIVSAIIADHGLIIGSNECQNKGDEVRAFRELIDLLDIKDSLIVADALHCKKKTAEKIIENGADYLLVVKDNNTNLKESIEVFSYNNKDDEYTTQEKNGGRIEIRTAYVSNNIEKFSSKNEWKNLSCVGAIHREVEKKGVKTSEWHYYICSRKLSAKELLKYARSEWQVESMHWLLDVHFLEDKTKVFDKNLQKVMNLLRKIVINLLRTYKDSQPKNIAFSRIMDRNLFDYENFSNVLQFLRNYDI